MTTNPDDGAAFPKIALDVLDQNQDTIRDELLRGFSDRREIVDWWQRAAVMTFGHIAEEWAPNSLLQDRTLLSHLVRDTRISDRARERYHAQWVEPACNDAYNHLKTEAVERLPDDSQDGNGPLAGIDAEKVEDPAMRPAFSTLNERQQECLRTLWGGFENRKGLSEWLHGLNSATYGEIDRTFSRQVMQDRVTIRYLLDTDEQQAAIYRVRLAISELLPAFATAAKRLQAGESAREGSERSDWEDRG